MIIVSLLKSCTWRQSQTNDSPPALRLYRRIDDLIPAPMTVDRSFDESYFGAKIRWIFLRPLSMSTMREII